MSREKDIEKAKKVSKEATAKVNAVDENTDDPENSGEDEEQQDGPEVREEITHLKTKTIPAIVMLLGGLVTSIYCFVRQYSVLMTLSYVFASLVIFLIVGGIVKLILDKITLKKLVIVDVPEEGDSEDGADENPEKETDGEGINMEMNPELTEDQSQG